MMDMLDRANISGFDARAYIHSVVDSGLMVPRVGIAVSGGGYRALMNGAGALSAFDSRTPDSTSPGGLGGVLQSATYLSGLSGGSWLVGSLSIQNFTTVDSIIHATEGFLNELWEFNETIIEGVSACFLCDIPEGPLVDNPHLYLSRPGWLICWRLLPRAPRLGGSQIQCRL